MSKEVDYKKAFEEVIKASKPLCLQEILQNEKIPFECCAYALEVNKKLNNKTLVTILSRHDCPTDFLVDICRKMKNKESNDFFERLCCIYHNWQSREIPEAALREFLDDRIDHLSLLCTCQYVSSPFKKELLDKILEYCRNKKTPLDNKKDNIRQAVRNFGAYQYVVTDDCWPVIDEILEILNDEYVATVFRFMRSPFDESLLDKNGYDQRLKLSFFGNKSNSTPYYQVACNPSISDYVVMELLVKTPSDYLEKVKGLVEKHEPARAEYRRLHPAK